MSFMPQPHSMPVASQDLVPAKPRRSAKQAILDAMVEAALSPASFRAVGSTYVSPSVQRVFALMDLIELGDRIRTSTGKWFTFSDKDDVDIFSPTPRGLHLMKVLCFLQADVARGGFERRLDPRLKLIFDLARKIAPLNTDEQVFHMYLNMNPKRAYLLFSALLDELRAGLNARQMNDKVRRHKNFDATYHKNLSSYFNGLNNRFPDAVVGRYELTCWQKSVPLVEIGWARDSHILAGVWLRKMKETHGDLVVGHAWRLQKGPTGNWEPHVLLVLNGIGQEDLPEIGQSAAAAWTESAGEGAVLWDCKARGYDLRYRGRSIGAPGDTLKDELADAAIYCALTDGLITLDFDDWPPQRGYRSMPKDLPQLVIRHRI